MPAPCCTLGCQLSLLCNEGFSLWFWVVGVGGKKVSPPTPVSSVAFARGAQPCPPAPDLAVASSTERLSRSPWGSWEGRHKAQQCGHQGGRLHQSPEPPDAEGGGSCAMTPPQRPWHPGPQASVVGAAGSWQEPAVGDVGPRSASGVSWLLGLHPAPSPSAMRQGVASLFSSRLTLADCPPAQCPVGVKGNPGPAPGKTLWAPGTSCLT